MAVAWAGRDELDCKQKEWKMTAWWGGVGLAASRGSG